jgi:hypothetical protein
MIGNTRMDPCSDVLKRKIAQRWLKEHAPDATLVFGIDWTEMRLCYKQTIDLCFDTIQCRFEFLLTGMNMNTRLLE